MFSNPSGVQGKLGGAGCFARCSKGFDLALGKKIGSRRRKPLACPAEPFGIDNDALAGFDPHRIVFRISRFYRPVITPLLVATTHRPPRWTIDSTRPTPGTTSPLETPIIPFGPAKIAMPSKTSLTAQFSIRLICVGAVAGFGAPAAMGGAEGWIGSDVCLVAAGCSRG